MRKNRSKQPQSDLFPETVVEKAAVPATHSVGNLARLVNLFGYGLWEDQPGPMDLEQALKLSPVLVALDIISQDIGKAPLLLRRKLPNGGSQIVGPREHYAAAMLADQPNPHHTWAEFIEMIVLHLGAVQNSFVAKQITRTGQATGLYPVMPGRVSILVDEESGNYVYDIQRYNTHERMFLREFERYLLPDEMIHFRGRMFDGLWGYSNLEAGSAVMALQKAVQDYQTRLYKNDAVLRGVFQMKNEPGSALSEEAFLRLKKQLSDLWTRMRTKGDPIVLEEGMEFKEISMNAASAETGKTKQAAIEDISRLFRIPPHKMMHIVNVKYENMETLEKSYVQDTLIPIARRIEQRLGIAMLSREERIDYFFEFDREAMMLTDVEKQAEIIKVMLNNGAMKIDEARARRGMNPLPNGAGDVRLVPANYQLVNDDNEVVLTSPDQMGENEDPDETEDLDETGDAEDEDEENDETDS